MARRIMVLDPVVTSGFYYVNGELFSIGRYLHFGVDDIVDVDTFDEANPYDGIEVVEKLVFSHHRLGRSGNFNRKMRLRQVYDQMLRVIGEHYSYAQRRHSGNDTRRRRHGDGKLIGNRNAHRQTNRDGYASELVPTEILFLTPGPADGVFYAESVRVK